MAITCFMTNPRLARAEGFAVSLSSFAMFLRIATTSSPIEEDITTCEPNNGAVNITLHCVNNSNSTCLLKPITIN